jgi:hypothetical protein
LALRLLRVGWSARAILGDMMAQIADFHDEEMARLDGMVHAALRAAVGDIDRARDRGYVVLSICRYYELSGGDPVKRDAV